MLNRVAFLIMLAIAVALFSGCANAEKKFGRGMQNTYEIVRMGELRRSIEQTSLFAGGGTGYSAGFVSGLNRTLARTGVGIYELITAPFPPYGPAFPNYLKPEPVYPDSYKPGMMEDTILATDANLGFSGGDVVPMVPGSRFRVFDTH